MSGMMQRILRGEMLCPNIYLRIAYNGVAVNVYPHWRHYHEIHGLPHPYWMEAAFDEIPF